MSLKEAALLQQLEHPNVIKVHSMQRNAAGTALFMVMQLCTGGELFDFIAEHGALPLSCALRYFKGIVTGLNYCHSKGVAHRDLKPENVIMPSKDLDDVALGDLRLRHGGVVPTIHRIWRVECCREDVRGLDGGERRAVHALRLAVVHGARGDSLHLKPWPQRIC